jgi:hypothetical protein
MWPYVHCNRSVLCYTFSGYPDDIAFALPYSPFTAVLLLGAMSHHYLARCSSIDRRYTCQACHVNNVLKDVYYTDGSGNTSK